MAEGLTVQRLQHVALAPTAGVEQMKAGLSGNDQAKLMIPQDALPGREMLRRQNRGKAGHASPGVWGIACGNGCVQNFWFLTATHNFPVTHESMRQALARPNGQMVREARHHLPENERAEGPPDSFRKVAAEFKGRCSDGLWASPAAARLMK
jgi:hypothetical protein